MGSECVAAQDAWNRQNSENQKSDISVFDYHALTSQITASYHTHNEGGDSGLSYESKS